MISHDLPHVAAPHLAEPSLALCQFLNGVSRLSELSARLGARQDRNGLTAEETAALEAWAAAATDFFEVNALVLDHLNEILERIAA